MKRIVVFVLLFIAFACPGAQAYDTGEGLSIGGHLYGVNLRQYKGNPGFTEYRATLGSGVWMGGLRHYWLVKGTSKLNLYAGLEGDLAGYSLPDYGMIGSGFLCIGFVYAELRLGSFSIGVDIGPAITGTFDFSVSAASVGIGLVYNATINWHFGEK